MNVDETRVCQSFKKFCHKWKAAFGEGGELGLKRQNTRREVSELMSSLFLIRK